ncbi:MAG: hypothetical protein ABGZ35_23950 [Planctomycetaceae bacterium]|jgi:hypothetical protein
MPANNDKLPTRITSRRVGLSTFFDRPLTLSKDPAPVGWNESFA